MNLPKLSFPKAVPREPDPPGVTVPQDLVDGAKWAAWVAYLALMYFLWLRVLAVSEAQAETLIVAKFLLWEFTLPISLHFPLIIGYCFVVVGVPFVAKIAIPILVSLKWKDNPYPKGCALFITVLVSVVLITGTATVGSDALIESQRGAAVATAQVRQQQAVLAGQISAKEAELKSMMENGNAYLAQAASVGAKEWQNSYIEKAGADDPQRDRIVRALGAARAADTVREELGRLRQAAATQAVAESVSSDVHSTKTDALSAILGPLNAFWVLLLAMVMDIVCLLMPWIALRLQQTRDAQLAAAYVGPMSDAYQIADHSAEAKLPVDPEGPRMNKVVDGETGEELVHVKGHMRVKRPKKNGRTEATLTTAPPDEPVFETPAIFGNDPRVARTAANEADAHAETVLALNDGMDRPDEAIPAADAGGSVEASHRNDDGRSAAEAQSGDVAYRDDLSGTGEVPVSSQTLTPPEEGVDGRDEDLIVRESGADDLRLGGELDLVDAGQGLATQEDQPAEALQDPLAEPVHEEPVTAADPFIAQIKALGFDPNDPDLNDKLRAAGFEVVDDTTIELDDRSYNFPRLPAPKQKEEAA